MDKNIFTYEVGFWVSWSFFKSTYLSRHKFLLILCSGGTCMYGTMPSMSVFRCPDRLHMMSDPWCPISWNTSKPGQPSFYAPLGKAEHLAKSSHPPLSPCQAISQWASNYSDWHMVRSYVKDIYLIYKQKIPQLIIRKETITFMVHFSNTRLLL